MPTTRLLLVLGLAVAIGPARAQVGLVPDAVVVPLPAGVPSGALGFRTAPEWAEPPEAAALPGAPLEGAAGAARLSSPGDDGPPLWTWDAGLGEALSPTALPLPPVATDSLPDGMPFYTALLWGEHGAVRALGLAPSTRRGELLLRRSMLQWHQRLGLATLGVMTAQVILGELVAADRAEHQDLVPAHRTLGYVTFGMYLGTASLSLGAPPARRYGGGFSNVQLHRYLALVHFTGMMAQPWLGAHLADAPSPEAYDDRLTAHQWVGRITYAAFGAAVLSIFFGF